MDRIRTEFDSDIDAYVVSLPGSVSLEALKIWGSEFIKELGKRSGKKGLLFDSNTHNFESTECLKWLKEFLTQELAVTRSINRVAFVQPLCYRKPEIVSESEAYFVNVQDAREWLNSFEAYC